MPYDKPPIAGRFRLDTAHGRVELRRAGHVAREGKPSQQVFDGRVQSSRRCTIESRLCRGCMPKHPAKLPRRAVREAERNAVDVIESNSRGSVFSSFHYSYTEITARGGKAHLRNRSTRFEDGKLSSESFEGEFDGSAYGQLVEQTQQYIANQTVQFLRSLSLFLPFSTKRPPTATERLVRRQDPRPIARALGVPIVGAGGAATPRPASRRGSNEPPRTLYITPVAFLP